MTDMITMKCDSKPVFTLSFVEDNLQGPQTQSHQTRPMLIDLGFRQLSCVSMWAVLDSAEVSIRRESRPEYSAEKIHRQVKLSVIQPQSGTNGWRQHDREAINREGPCRAWRRKGVSQNRCSLGWQTATPRACRIERKIKHAQIGASPHSKRTDGEDSNTAHVEALRPMMEESHPLSGSTMALRQVGRQHPCALVGSAERLPAMCGRENVSNAGVQHSMKVARVTP